MCIFKAGPSMGPNPVTGKGIKIAAEKRKDKGRKAGGFQCYTTSPTNLGNALRLLAKVSSSGGCGSNIGFLSMLAEVQAVEGVLV